jgi:RNase P/RNase MRP subunit p29
LQELSELNRQANDSTQDRIGILESVLYDKLNTLEIQIQSQQKNIPQPNV